MTRPTILCVDDEKIVLDSLKVQLKNCFGQDCNIELAESGSEALEIVEEVLEEHGIPPSIIICDQIMPHMKGDKLLSKIKNKFPKTLSILLTGQADLQDIISAINNVGLYRYLTKPWDTQDLNRTVKQALIAHQQDFEIEIRNQQLIELNKNLEKKITQRTEEITKQKEELELKNKNIGNSLNYAKRIQDVLLPKIPDRIGNQDLDFFIVYKPQQVVSGDFYWCKRVKNFVYIAVIDCTGHGIPGALMSMIGYELLFNSIISKKIKEPCEILNDIHASMVKTLKQKYSLIQDGMDMTLCCIDLEKQILKFAGAKNPIWYIKNGELSVIRGDSLAIGGMVEIERNFTQHEIEYDNTMNFYLSSDGYMNQFGGEYGKKFSRKSFRELLMNNYHKPMKEQGEILEQTLIEWQGEENQVDDITVVGFRIPTELNDFS